MTKRLNKSILYDILESSENCISFCKVMSFQEFEKDLKTSFAVLHQLMVIGEAVKKLDKEFINDNPVLPWKDIAGTRDILIHNYDEADLEEVWDIVQNYLPKVVQEVESLLKKMN